MMKAWIPVMADINNEIERIKSAIADIPFNSDFSSRMQVLKMRTAELDTRISQTVHVMRSEAASQREMINGLMAEFMKSVEETRIALSELRQFRAERSHANWVHVMEIKKREAEEGGEE